MRKAGRGKEESRINKEGYKDPTAEQAVHNVTKKRWSEMKVADILEIKKSKRQAGFLLFLKGHFAITLRKALYHLIWCFLCEKVLVQVIRYEISK